MTSPQRRREIASVEVVHEPQDVLERIAGQFLANLAANVEEEIHLARAEPIMLPALENDRPAWTAAELVPIIDDAPLTRVAHPACFLCYDQASNP